MNAIRLFILTTDGPVEVQRITAEDPSVKSVICLDGRAVSLPISPDYEAFVRAPTGVVEAYFGHPAYRLDVARRISEGMSWQLGVFMAHALHARGALASGPAETAVFLTGEVDRDLRVLPVDDVPDKLRQAADLIGELAEQGVASTVFVPVANAPEHLDDEPPNYRLFALETVTQAFEALGLQAPATALPARIDAAAGPPRRRSRALPLLAATAAVLAIGLWAANQPLMEEAAIAATPPPAAMANLATTLIETRAPPGKTCAAVNFKRIKPVIVEATVSRGGRFADSPARGVCALTYRIVNKGPPIDRSGLAVLGARGDALLRPKAFFRNRRLETSAPVSLNVKPPPRASQPVRLEFLLIAQSANAGAAPEASTLPDEITPNIWREIKAAAARDDRNIFTITHEFAP